MSDPAFAWLEEGIPRDFATKAYAAKEAGFSYVCIHCGAGLDDLKSGQHEEGCPSVNVRCEEQLAVVAALAEKATPGPWDYDGRDIFRRDQIGAAAHHLVIAIPDTFHQAQRISDEDIAFIIAARNLDWPALYERDAQMRAVVDAWRVCQSVWEKSDELSDVEIGDAEDRLYSSLNAVLDATKEEGP